MAATFFGYAVVPTTDDGTNTADPTSITPPSSMQEGDLVVLWATCRTASATIAISAAGGQTWNSEDSATSTNITSRLFWCRFNGTWSTNPSVSFGATTCNSVSMLVFRPTTSTNLWALDQGEAVNSFSAPSSPNYTVTITGQTTTHTSVAVALWSTTDNNTWGTLSGTGWSKTSLPAQSRNSSGQDTSQTWAYNIQSGAGATNNVSQNQATLGGDLGVAAIACFYEYAPPVTLTLSDASHSSTSDNIALFQAHTLAGVASCSFSHESTTPTLVQQHALAVDSASFSSAAETISWLVQHYTLTMSSAAFDHGAENVVLESVLEGQPEIISTESFLNDPTGTPPVGTRSLTIPSDCTLVLLSWGTFAGTGGDLSSATINSVALTKAVSKAGDSGVTGNTGFWYLANPATGSQTLTMNWNSSDNGRERQMFVTYLKGASLGNPVRDADVAATPGDPGTHQTWTTPDMVCETADLAFAVCFDYVDSDGVADAAPTGSGQTQLATGYSANTYGAALGYKVVTSSGTTTVSGAGRYAATLGVIITGTAGDATLVVSDASLSSTCDGSLALTEHKTLAVADAAVSAECSGSLALIEHKTLAVSDASLALTADNVDLVTAGAITVQDASLSSVCDGPLALFQAHVLAVQNAELGSSADNVGLVPDWRLAVADASLSSASENVALNELRTLAVDGASISCYADNIGLVAEGAISVQNAVLESTAGSVVLFQAHTLAVQDASFESTAGSPVLARTFNLEVQDAALEHAAGAVVLSQVHVLAVSSAAISSTATDLLLQAQGLDRLTVASCSFESLAHTIVMLDYTAALLNAIDVDPRPLTHTVEPRRYTVEVDPRPLTHTVEPRA